MPHMHFVCKKCGEIYDFPIDKNLPESIKSEGFLVEPAHTVYHGICKNCLKKI
jgi:Fe2+ or Zn2+ uptake regulation protein